MKNRSASFDQLKEDSIEHLGLADSWIEWFDALFYTMNRIDNPDVQKRIANIGTFLADEARSQLRDIKTGVEETHEKAP